MIALSFPRHDDHRVSKKSLWLSHLELIIYTVNITLSAFKARKVERLPQAKKGGK